MAAQVGLLAAGVIGAIKLAPKIVKRLREEFINAEGGKECIKELTQVAKKLDQLTPKDKLNKAFDYINQANTPKAGKRRIEEMFEDIVDVDDLIGEEVGSLDNAFIKSKVKKTMGGSMLSRQNYDEGGSLMVPPEMEDMADDMPVDTYPNIPPEEMAEAEASQLPDVEMEDKYMDFVVNESLDNEEQSYLMNALEADPMLSQIFDKVITTASEFTGAGEVEGPGTGVSDSIPARLSDGEFVFTKKATDQMGADNLQMMMDDAERAFDGGEMRSPKQEGGMMYKQKDEDPLAYEKIAQDEIKKNMLRANRAPSLLGGN